jgi:pimeloyl-ACP methyl ester carboxylesterase
VSIASKVFVAEASKPALVLVHGLGSAGTIWKSLIPDLVSDFTVYPIDLPGHGDADLAESESYDPRSLGQLILDFMKDVHDVHEMHVAGNSLGGWISLEMAALAPDRVASVTALAPAGLWLEAPTMVIPPSIDSRILAKISQFFMPIAFHLAPLKAIGYRKITHLWRELSYETCRDSVIAMARSKGYRPLWQGIRGRKFDAVVDPKVKMSIVFGDGDITLPESLAQEKSVAPSHARWIRVENCAHVIMWNHPEITVKLIRETADLR